ncbi:MAG: glutamine--fructose-6-phosphate transaminase (isomerizing) [Myxococcales bacterium]|nr:glutamine--fructose-6-phosphate transaminase (isomerizing) [Myxococcales bacterium]
MCGIVGYVGPRQSAEILLGGLERLEYRGYDSAGLAIFDGRSTRVVRSVGKLHKLVEQIRREPLEGKLGLGHTRWATHGRPSEENAHPHTAGPITVVHNGIIENHLPLRAGLEARGHSFLSETDTEILSHLIRERCDRGDDLEAAVRGALAEVEGSYAIAVISANEPDKIVAAKNASPLVVGFGDGETFLASDIPALLSHTRDVVFLHEGELVVLTRDGARITTLAGEPVERARKHITWTPSQAEKGGYKHFMLKEIHEQPRAMTDTLRGRVSLERGDVHLEDVHLDAAAIAKLDRIYICACGTAWHAGLVAKRVIEQCARVPVEVDLASEFRYRDPLVTDRSLFIAISQSGETADTLAALKEARRRGARILSICNVIESSIARESDDIVYTHAGPEIGVASTKAFMTQMLALHLFAVWLGRRRGTMNEADARARLEALVQIPGVVEGLVSQAEKVEQIASKYVHARDFLYLGRGENYPIALEGALKLKEISYIHAEGYAAGEMKHGPIALIDEEMPVVVITPEGSHYDKTASNLQEVRARLGRVIAVATEGDGGIEAFADDILRVPRIEQALQPFATTVPLQLLAYYVADLKGTDVDQPRNLAKSVTVE